MKLSIIVPTLDGRVPESLMRAVEGRTDVEVVVVKGVSPVGKARNEGLRRAKGEYIAWVDGDDEVAEDWLVDILVAIDGNAPDIITFDAARVGWAGDGTDVIWRERHPSVERLLYSAYQAIERMCSMWLFVSRRELWKGLGFDEDAVICEDYFILPKFVGRAKSLTYIRKKLYRYISRETSLVHRYGFTGDPKVMDMRRRYVDEAPRKYRSATTLGLATAYYGVSIRVAHGFEEFRSEEWRHEADLARRFVRRNLLRILGEVVFRTRLPLREKIGWVLRFLWNCLPAWMSGIVRVRR